MRLTRIQMTAMERMTRARTDDASPEIVAAEVADALRTVTGWDGYRIFSIDPATLRIGRLLAATERDAAQRQRWLRDGYQAEERVPFGSFGMEARMRMGIRAITFHEDLDQSYGMPASIKATYDPKRYVESHYSHVVEYHPGVTIDGNLLMNFPDGQRWVAFLQAYRVSSRRPFRASDIAFAHLVAPRMGEAIGAALLREQLQPEAAPPAGGASGIVVVSRDGEIQYASPAGEEWLTALRRHPLEAQTVLPTAILSSIAGLRSGRESALARVALPGTVAAIEAAPGGSDGSIALVVAPSRPVAGVPRLPAAWGLTPAESRVAARVIAGQSNREVADTLSVSENTVEWHLRRIFDKLGVRSRNQLAALNLND